MKKSTVPQWNLSDIYKSITDPKISKDKKTIESNIVSLSKNFKKVSLLKSLKLYEEIKEGLDILSNHAHLNYSTNTKDEKLSNYFQATSEYVTNLETKLLWFEVYVIKSKEKVKNYDYFLKSSRVFKPYTLDEDKESIITKKNQTGHEAFIKFYDLIESDQDYDGKTYSEVAATFSSHPDRNKRKKAGEAIANKLKSQGMLYKFILNTLLLDKKVSDEMRGYEYPQQATFLSYDIDPNIVKTMSSVITKNHKISERYYQAKSKLLNFKLAEWDRYNEVFPDIKTKVNWDKAKEIILNSFNNFSDVFGSEANKFFENNWIDAKVGLGKHSGAFCSYVSNSIHPYIFMNFTNDSRDVETLAHELGHAVHGVLAKNNNYVDFRPSTATAEIASVFCESIVFDDLYKLAKSKKEKANLLGNMLQGRFATVFRQNAFYLFESELHKLRREKGELSLEEIGNLYQDYLQPMFGQGLTLSKNHKYMWMLIAHFYHYNFYVFTYSFGELLATSLYAIYKKDGQKFVDKYIKALSLGGSKSPLEITKSMGVDIESENFWQSGLDLINDQVKKFEELVI